MKKVNIKDVAKHSGFSVATVSAVINGVPIVSERSKEKILNTIDELGYRPNFIARSLKKSKTLSLGILVRDITNPFYPEVISGIEEFAWANNYEVFLCNTENDSKREEKYIENLINKQVDGVFITTSNNERNKAYDKLRESGIPYIYVNRKPETLLEGEYFVGTDNIKAVDCVVQYLKEMGLTEIAFLAGPQEFFTFKQRLSGFRTSMINEGLPIKEEWIYINHEYNEEVGYKTAEDILKCNPLPQCIFCTSDLLAFGVYQALNKAGMKIPGQISLISIDNNRFGSLIGLSSVDMNNKEIGRKAGKKMLDLLNNNAVLEQEVLLIPKLVTRTSCLKNNINWDGAVICSK